MDEIARLRRADPARAYEAVDPAAVRARIAIPSFSRARRRRVELAAAIVTALAVGAGGYLLGSLEPGPMGGATADVAAAAEESDSSTYARDLAGAEAGNLEFIADPGFLASPQATAPGSAHAYAIVRPKIEATQVGDWATGLGAPGPVTQTADILTVHAGASTLEVASTGAVWFDGGGGDEPPAAAESGLAAAQGFLAAFGEDPAGYEWAVEAEDPLTIEAHRQVEGHPYNHWGFVAEADRIIAAWGDLADLRDLGPVPTAPAAEAIARLSDPRFGAGVRSLHTEGATAPGPAPVPSPGDPLPWPVRTVTITGADPALVPVPASWGTLLLPGYDLSGADGGRWLAVAVDERFLQYSSHTGVG